MKNITLLFLTIILISFSSCEKVIDVKIKSTAAQYVIVGNVSTQAGPYTVSITKTVDFQQSNNFPGITGARVVITDQTAGVSDTLTEAAPGNYVTNILSGQEGHTYLLYVHIDNQVFTASSTIPVKVNMDSLYQQIAEFGEGVNVVPVYTDPAGTRNFYHFIKYVNNKRSEELYFRRDILTDGKQLSVPLNLGADTSMTPGSTVTVDMETIDEFVYQYYRTLDETIGQNSAAPANPIMNINGAKLGYFSAHAVSTRSITIN